MAQGPSRECAFNRHFARASYFILHNTRTGKSEAIRNELIISDTRIGKNTVPLLKMKKPEAGISKEIGDNSRALRRGEGILLHIYKGSGMVKDAIDTVL